jgi:hypothetical protein
MGAQSTNTRKAGWSNPMPPQRAARPRHRTDGNGPRKDRPGSAIDQANSQAAPRTQVLRAGNAAACATCGEPLTPKRGSRRQRFCCYRCRDEARRTSNFALSGVTRRGSQGIPRSIENNDEKSIACKADFGHRASAISGPTRVIDREIVAGRNWQPVISPDGVNCSVARRRR